ncbi:MAG: hypothetical protein ACR2LL_13615 [Nitrosopumilus sp.]
MPQYDRMSEEKKLRWFLKLESELLIDNIKRKKIKNQKLEIEKTELEKKVSKIKELKQKMESFEKLKQELRDEFKEEIKNRNQQSKE